MAFVLEDDHGLRPVVVDAKVVCGVDLHVMAGEPVHVGGPSGKDPAEPGD
jgi:hypothetical protein